MPTDYVPHRDADLLNWASVFKDKIEAAPTEYSLTIGQATQLASLFNTFSSAFATTLDPATRTGPAITAKNDAKEALSEYIRVLAGIIQAATTTTNPMRQELGLPVRGTEPSPIPAPDVQPLVEVVSRLGTTVRIRLHDGSGTRRGKPEGVDGAMVFSYVGATAPADITEWTLVGQATRTIVDLEFDPMLAPGTTIWACAFWFNPRGQNGPGSVPVSATLAGGAMEEAA